MDIKTKLGQQLAIKAAAGELHPNHNGSELVCQHTKSHYGITTLGRIYEARRTSGGRVVMHFPHDSGDYFERGSLSHAKGEKRKLDPFTVAELLPEFRGNVDANTSANARANTGTNASTQAEQTGQVEQTEQTGQVEQTEQTWSSPHHDLSDPSKRGGYLRSAGAMGLPSLGPGNDAFGDPYFN